MTRSKRIAVLVLMLCCSSVYAQDQFNKYSFIPMQFTLEQESAKPEYPDPNMVLKRSLIIPGWGQITNKQAWKVPIVYGLLGGLTYYSIDLNIQYHDYRAAYYNQVTNTGDLRFGSTPAYLEGQSSQSLKSNRDFLRNRRDFIYVTIALAYILNAVDAYVFAHLRSFDVSDDLSMNHTFEPTTITSASVGHVPGVSLKVSF